MLVHPQWTVATDVARCKESLPCHSNGSNFSTFQRLK